MFGRKSKNTSHKSKSQWYEWPLFLVIITAAFAFVGQFVVTLLPIWSSDTGDFYISVEPVPIEAKLISYELLPTTMENWSQLKKEPQHPDATVTVQDINGFIKNYRYPIFLKSDDNYNKLHNLIIRFQTPTIEPPFSATMFVYTTNSTESIDNLPITIEGIGGDGKRRNCTVYIFYRSPHDLAKEGIAQAVLGNYSGSIALFDKSIEIDQSYALAWKNKAIVLTRYLNQDENGLRCINQSLILNPKDEEALCVKGIILSRLGYNNESLKFLDQAIGLNPDHVLAWNSKGIALDDLTKYDEAIKAFDEAIRLDPNYAEAWYNKGNALCKLTKYDEAIKAFDEAIRLDPNDAEIWNNKGIALGNLKKYDEAIKAFDEAIRLDPNHASAWYNKGNALQSLGRTTESEAAFAKAKDLWHEG